MLIKRKYDIEEIQPGKRLVKRPKFT